MHLCRAIPSGHSHLFDKRTEDMMFSEKDYFVVVESVENWEESQFHIWWCSVKQQSQVHKQHAVIWHKTWVFEPLRIWKVGLIWCFLHLKEPGEVDIYVLPHNYRIKPNHAKHPPVLASNALHNWEGGINIPEQLLFFQFCTPLLHMLLLFWNLCYSLHRLS